MKSISVICFIILCQARALADLNVKVHFSPIANLVYQLDCVGGVLNHCSRNTYLELWKKEFLKTDEDQSVLKKWSELISRYRESVDFSNIEKVKVPGRNKEVVLSTKLRIASFQSLNSADYFNRLDLIVVPNDRQRFEEVINHFYPMFEKWWKKIALPKGKGFAKETETLLKRQDIAKKLKQYRHFYEAELPDKYEVHFNLFYRPDAEESTAGQQLENYSVTEFLPTEKPADRLDVVIHELCHFFYANSADQKFVNLQKSFASTGKLESRGAFNLLNEALASAFGNGIINKLNKDSSKWEKYFNKPLSFYNNRQIDKASKSILSWLEGDLEQRKTLYDPSFVEKYLSILKENLGNELTAPKLILNELILVADISFEGKFRDMVRNAFRTSSMYASQGPWSDNRTLKSYIELPNLSALVIIQSENINQLLEKEILNKLDFELLKKYIKENNQIIFGYNRGSNVPAYIVVASNFEEAAKLVEKLSQLPEGFTGPAL